ncbi:MAG: alpha-ketoacid dehydrogenase subunit beta [Candidatus Tectomicrobia bacterium]|uniref:Alpha-ketoacid dehydrogenase subunit beta n=1 Tax=Tectimicrobiota bacterium TaxID=2528274 RepID=A0A932CR47_UNCTE|nr:alpha-ketoacid dehydrogenase subunit beta [Candidatus Tectomicrobia bacterium]
MKNISFRDALREAMREEMLRDESVFVAGEDVEIMGGAFGVTKGLVEQFGKKRVRNTPISEVAIIGCAVGAAATGLRPVVEIMIMDFITVCMDQIVNQAAKMRYMFGGKIRLPLVIRTASGAGFASAAQHSQSLEAWFTHVPGIKVVMPATPYDAKGLLKSAIRDDNPVLFIEPKGLYRFRQEVTEEDYTLPLGKAEVKREGRDVTVVTYGQMVHTALAAAQRLESERIGLEVIDLRSLSPLDKGAILSSVEKTGRLIVLHEACKTGGFGAEVAALVAEEGFDLLDAPIRRVAAPDIPVPYTTPLERFYIPDEKDLIAAVREIV